MGLLSSQTWSSLSTAWREVLVFTCVFVQVLILVQVSKWNRLPFQWSSGLTGADFQGMDQASGVPRAAELALPENVNRGARKFFGLQVGGIENSNDSLAWSIQPDDSSLQLTRKKETEASTSSPTITDAEHAAEESLNFSQGNSEAEASGTQPLATKVTKEAVTVPKCDGRRIYLYDYLPSKFNQDLVTNCKNPCDNGCDDLCPSLLDDGLGSDLDRSNDSNFMDEYEGSSYAFGPWRGTQQNLVGVLFRARMQSYECLTTDWKAADAFYIPALFGLETLFGSQLQFFEIEALGDELEVFLKSQPGYLRNGGKDHFYVVGQQYNDFMCHERNKPGTDWSWCSWLYYRPMLDKMTMVSVERPWWETRIQSIPYLTAFHPGTLKELQEWLQHVKNHPKPHKVTLLAGRRSSVEIRKAVLSACEAQPSKCHFFDCSGECPRGSCRKVTGVCGEPRLVAKEYLASTFCLMPNGDSATRRSIFDALIAGCIPVHFDHNSFNMQYPWHRGGDPARVAVLFDQKGTENGTLDFLAELHSIPQAKVAEMQKNILDLIPSLITKDHTRADSDYKQTDLFDVAVEGILQHLKKPVEYPW